MNHVTELVRTGAIALERFEHDSCVAHRDPEVERAATHAINFVETGSFRVRVGGGWREVTPRDVFVTSPGLEFSCAHDAEYPDDSCLSVRYSDDAVESLRREGASTTKNPLTAMTNRRGYLRLQLGKAGRGDEARAEAIAGALFWSLGSEPKARR